MISELFAGLVRLITGARLMPHEQNQKSNIYFALHQSNLDALVIWASLPKAERKRLRPVAADDYWKASPLKHFIAVRLMRSILIHRDAKPSRHSKPLAPLINALEEGDSILIFPQGTRRQCTDQPRFKSGLFHLARALPRVPLIPVELENLGRILPAGERLPLPLIARVEKKSPIVLTEGESKTSFLDRCITALQPAPITS